VASALSSSSKEETKIRKKNLSWGQGYPGLRTLFLESSEDPSIQEELNERERPSATLR